MSRNAAAVFARQFSTKQLHQYHQNYLDFTNSQLEHDDQSLAEDEFPKCFRAFSNLRVIEFDAGRRIPRSKLQDQVLDLKDLGGIAQHTLVEREYRSGFPRHSRHLRTLLKTCEESRSFIAPTWTEFNSLGMSHRMFRDKCFFLVPDGFPPDVIRALNLSFQGPSVSAGSMSSHRQLSWSLQFITTALLRNTSNLRSLTLSPLGRSEDRRAFLRMAPGIEYLQIRLFYRQIFPHLMHLDMSGFYLSEDCLRTFLKDHSATLRELRLSNMVLSQSSELPSAQAVERSFDPPNDDPHRSCTGDDLDDTTGLPAAAQGASWIKLLSFIRADLDLNHLQLGGFLLEGLPEMSFEELQGDHPDLCWSVTDALERVRHLTVHLR